MPHTRFNRRHFVKSAVALGASGFLSRNAFSKTSPSYPLKGRLYKTLKINMIRIEASLTEKFRAAKAAGFMGVEMNSPGMDVAETRAAIAASGLPVDGTVCSTHWKIRHSSPDATVRAQASEDLKQRSATHTLSAVIPFYSLSVKARMDRSQRFGQDPSRTSKKPFLSQRNWAYPL